MNKEDLVQKAIGGWTLNGILSSSANQRKYQEDYEKLKSAFISTMIENGLNVDGKHIYPYSYGYNLVKGIREKLYTP